MKLSKLEVNQSNNRILIKFDGEEIFLETNGYNLPLIKDFSFALFFILPLAMQRNIGIESDLQIDSEVINNCSKLVKIWSTWVPERFSLIEISTENSYTPIAKKDNNKDLYLYSGGVDSTFMLISDRKEIRENYALTIHGLDYKLKKEKEFNGLIQKTDKVLDFYKTNRIILKTNAGKVLGGLDLNHGFCLAGSVFLFKESFFQAFLASDYNRLQEHTVFPWGTNSKTNKLFSGSDFKLNNQNLDLTRIQKIEEIANNELVLNSIVFCSDSRFRPNNCGRCNKCIRTKMMFLIQTGYIPEIFIDNSFTESHIKALDLKKRSEIAFIEDIINTSKQNKNIELLLNLPQKYSEYLRALNGSKRNMLSKFIEKVRLKKHIDY